MSDFEPTVGKKLKVEKKIEKKIEKNEYWSLPSYMIIGSEEMKYNLEFQKYLTAKDVKYLMDLCDSPNPVFGGDNNSKSITRRGGAATRKGVYENAIAKLEATSSSKFKEGQENKLNVEVPSDSPNGYIPLQKPAPIAPIAPFPNLVWKSLGKSFEISQVINSQADYDKKNDALKREAELKHSVFEYRSCDIKGEPNTHDTTAYIWTRDAANIASVFMRLDDLKDRLGEGAAYFYAKDYEAVNPSQVDGTFRQPFPLWNSAGELVSDRNQQRWNEFLVGPSNQGGERLSAQFIQYWTIAHQAGLKRKEGGPLSFRYWNKSTAVKDQKTDPLPEDKVDIFMRCNKCITNLPGDWVTTMKDGPIAEALKKTGFNPTITPIKWDDLQFNDMCRIGAHPLGLYETWVTQKGLDDLLELNKKTLIFQDSLPTPTDNQTAGPRAVEVLKNFYGNPARHVNGLFIVPGQTKTTISTATLQAAPKKRSPSQKGVMGWSATDVARKLWPEDEFKSLNLAAGDVEWLHRSAFSFGKPNNLPSPQNPANMVFGTKETNTVMLRAEDFVKRLSRRTESEVTLRTYRHFETSDLMWMYAYPWLAPTLLYDFQSTASASHPQHYYRIYFSPFERKMPVFMETYLDIAVENLLFGWNSTEEEDSEEEDDTEEDEHADAGVVQT